MLKYKQSTEEDLPVLNEWVAADLDHAPKCEGSFFVLKPDEKGVQCIRVEDDQGIVFYLKLTNALLVDTQFPPNVDKERTKAALTEAFQFFSAASKNMGYHAMLFDSVSPSLIRFFQRFGFKRLTDFFKVNL